MTEFESHIANLVRCVLAWGRGHEELSIVGAEPDARMKWISLTSSSIAKNVK